VSAERQGLQKDLDHSVKFDEFAGNYDLALEQGLSATGENREFFARGRIQLLKSHLDRLDFRPERTMEFGCGTGANIPLLLNLPGTRSVIGIDVSKQSLEVAKKAIDSPAARFALNSEYRPDGQIDLAFSCGVFHHIDPTERKSAIEYVRDSLRPGGIFALWENNPWNPGTRLVMRRIPFDSDAITLSSRKARRLLSAGGFRVLSCRYMFIFPHLLRWLRGLEVPLAGLPLGGQYQLLARKT
jgi:SAM-dependent methyltransferase